VKLGLVTYNLGKDWDVPTLIKHCAAAGFEGVELRSTHAHKVESTLSKAERAEVRKRFEDSPVELYGLGTAFDYHRPDPAELKKHIEGTKEYVLLAADVGAMGVKVRPNGMPKEVDEAKTFEQIGTSYREVARFGADHGIQLWMEVHGRDTADPRRMKRIIDIADHPNARVCWNCNLRSKADGGEIDESGSIAWGLDPLMDKIGEVHIHDLYDPYPYRELFGKLLGAGFSQYTGVESPGSPDAARILKFYRALWSKMILSA